MDGEVPQNEVRSSTHEVPITKLFDFLTKLNDIKDVVRVSYVLHGSRATVTVEYAIMNLTLQLAAVAHKIGDAAGTNR